MPTYAFTLRTDGSSAGPKDSGDQLREKIKIKAWSSGAIENV